MNDNCRILYGKLYKRQSVVMLMGIFLFVYICAILMLMTIDYAEAKVSEALRLSGGNLAKARRLIHTWLYEDPKLLLELTRPHWNGIVAYAVDRAATRAKNGITPKKAVKKPEKADSFGKDVLRSFVAEHAAQFGRESAAAPIGKRTASQNHVDAIHLIVAKSKTRRRDE